MGGRAGRWADGRCVEVESRVKRVGANRERGECRVRQVSGYRGRVGGGDCGWCVRMHRSRVCRLVWAEARGAQNGEGGAKSGR